jgi:hypothetical protein
MPRHNVAVAKVIRPTKPTLVQVLRPLEVSVEPRPVELRLSRPRVDVFEGKLVVLRVLG